MINLAANPRVAHAFNRFGLGGRPDDVVPSDPLAWAQAQLAGSDPAVVAGMPSVDQGLALLEMIEYLPSSSPAWLAALNAIYAIFLAEIQVYFGNAVMAQAPFRERLVQFWTDHFAIMAQTAGVMATAGAFVRDAIRPYVTGKFADMLVAVMHHPAMLYSLDNDSSVGPNSAVAIGWAKAGWPVRGMNENLGRETLELYTVGVGAGYTQADVDAMALLLTGWKVNITSSPRGFVFDPASAEPGNQVLLGASYPGTEQGCITALRMLATHPATCNHLATKLVAHFVSDTPSAADVAVVAGVLAKSGCDLAQATAALLSLPNAWKPLTKVRPPVDLAIAAMRATGASATDIPNMFAGLLSAGDLPWLSPFPNGWADDAADWTAPQQIMLRLSWLQQYAAASLGRATPPTLAATLGCSMAPFLTARTFAAIAQVSNPVDQLTVLLGAPEFQRR